MLQEHAENILAIYIFLFTFYNYQIENIFFMEKIDKAFEKVRQIGSDLDEYAIFFYMIEDKMDGG